MSADFLAAIFVFSTLLIVPDYLLMVFFPDTVLTQRVMGSLWSVLPSSLLLVIFGSAFVLTDSTVFSRFLDLLASSLNGGAFSSLQQVVRDFPPSLLVLWMHAVAADLVMARWAYLESRQLHLNPRLSSLALLLMASNGPLGFIVYFLVRELTQNRRKHAQLGWSG
jgi:hypothetical protein